MSVSEQQVAETVVAYLDALGADVYQEVEVAGGVADIVAKVRAEYWIVEVKTTFSLRLIYQAIDRRRLAHRVFVATPLTRRSRASEICDALGIGLWDVTVGDAYCSPRIDELLHGRRWNVGQVDLASQLQPEHKTHAKAGAIGAGGRWTPFRQTCEELARIVRLHPGITVKAAVAEIKHHYRSKASAISSLVHWVERGKIDGVRLDRTAPVLALQPAGDAQ